MRLPTAAALVLLGIWLAPMPLTGAAQALVSTSTHEQSAEATATVNLHIKPLPDGVRRVKLQRNADGGRWFVVEYRDGRAERLSPQDFAALLDPGEKAGGFLFRLLNITSAAGFLWVAVGLLGQVLFTGRMLLQWVVSEREKRSVVPVGFWWMSLSGASMLLLYFVWRKDIVGVLGQCTGWFIYARNLWLIYHEQQEQAQ